VEVVAAVQAGAEAGIQQEAAKVTAAGRGSAHHLPARVPRISLVGARGRPDVDPNYLTDLGGAGRAGPPGCMQPASEQLVWILTSLGVTKDCPSGLGERW
jgi:hypothetical protein